MILYLHGYLDQQVNKENAALCFLRRRWMEDSLITQRIFVTDLIKVAKITKVGDIFLKNPYWSLSLFLCMKAFILCVNYFLLLKFELNNPALARS